MKSLYIIFLAVFLFPVLAFGQTNIKSVLETEFDFSGKPVLKIQYFTMESIMNSFAPDGKKAETLTLKLKLKAVPAGIAKKQFDEYTCLSFKIQYGDSLEVAIPELTNWTYGFNPGLDSTGQVFGIDHQKFNNMKDERGEMLRQDYSYHVYNCFIDFHAFCNVFTQPTTEGKGIQHLKKIGQKIIHASANSQPPTHLGENIAEGSFFKNGEITLQFKGLSLVNNEECAIFGVDSGESAFKMIIEMSENFKVVTVGGSHYQGDIYKSLESGWVQKVCFSEMVVSETTLPVPPNKINSIAERSIVITNQKETGLHSP